MVYTLVMPTNTSPLGGGAGGDSQKSLEDYMSIIQAIVNLRQRAPPASPEISEKMRSIEQLLNEDVLVPNWRRGAVITGGHTTAGARRAQTAAPGANRWKAPQDSQPMASQIKYESRFKNGEAAVEDTILNTIILNKLNKFSVNTYVEVRDFLYQILDSGEINFIKEFMRLVFKKAAAEEIFCPLYAKLLSEIRVTYPVIQSEMIALFKSYLTIFKNMNDISSSDYHTFVERNTEKKYRLGYSQFLAELVSLEAVDVQSLESTFSLLIANIHSFGLLDNQQSEVQEYTDCILRMTRVIHKKNTNFFINLRKLLFEIVKDPLESVLSLPKEMFPSISPKARFALMDIRDNLA